MTSGLPSPEEPRLGTADGRAPSARGWRCWLAKPWLWIVVGIVLVLPALTRQFALDDFFHVASLESEGDTGTAFWQLFSFVPEGTAGRATSTRLGILPWWAQPDLKIAFFRPLSSALVAFDHTLFGRHALGWHAHGLLWWAGLLLTVALLFRRELPGKIGVLALALFAIDDAHWMSIVWSAARNGLVATTPALLGLCAHLRWRRHGWAAGSVLAPLGFAAGLAGGEAALGMLAYVVAFELIDGAAAAWPRRLAAMIPLVLVLSVYGMVRAAVGAGVSGSGAYLDPMSDPIAFARAAISRVPVLLGNLVWNVPADLTGVGPRAAAVLAIAGLVAAIFVGLWLRSALRRLPDREAQSIRWLGLGALLSLFPCASAIPGERVVLPASIGAAAVFAALLRDGASRWRQLRGRFLLRGLAGAALAVLALPNLVLAGPSLVGKLFLWKSLEEGARRTACSVPASSAGPMHELLVWSDYPAFAQFGGGARWFYCPEGMASWTILSLSPHAQTLSRPSPSTLVLDFLREPGLDAQWEVLFRDGDHPLRAGDTFGLQEGLRAVVEKAEQGRPRRVRFELGQRPIWKPWEGFHTFPRSGSAEPSPASPSRLDQSPFRLLLWRGGQLRPVELPVGQSIAFGAGA
jgi:hypothetical protein